MLELTNIYCELGRIRTYTPEGFDLQSNGPPVVQLTQFNQKLFSNNPYLFMFRIISCF